MTVRRTSIFDEVYIFSDIIVCTLSDSRSYFWRNFSIEQLNVQTPDKYEYMLMLILWRLQLVWRQHNKKTNFTVWLLIESAWPMYSCAREWSKQLPLRKLISNWGDRHRIHAESSPKAASEKAQFAQTIWHNARASFLVDHVPRTSASLTLLLYRRMFTQFSLCVWVSEYTGTFRPIIE